MPRSLSWALWCLSVHRYEVLESHFDYDASHYPKALGEVPVTSFFGSVSNPRPTPSLKESVGDVAISSDGAGADEDPAGLGKTATAGSNAASGAGHQVQECQKQGVEQSCSVQNDSHVCEKSKVPWRAAVDEKAGLRSAYAGLAAMVLGVALAGMLLGKLQPWGVPANAACM